MPSDYHVELGTSARVTSNMKNRHTKIFQIWKFTRNAKQFAASLFPTNCPHKSGAISFQYQGQPTKLRAILRFPAYRDTILPERVPFCPAPYHDEFCFKTSGVLSKLADQKFVFPFRLHIFFPVQGCRKSIWNILFLLSHPGSRRNHDETLSTSLRASI